jgi:threonine dehydratase
MFILNLPLIEQASSFLQGKIRKTPTEFSPTLSELLNVPVYFKLECLQITGSFKIRGALFYLSTLQEEEKRHGVAACSVGNHGLGVAFAAK